MLKTYTYLLLFYTLFLFYFINATVPAAYMDEIFHFPQALKYYNGIYSEWDPKITTPPGLYLSTVAVLVPLSQVSGLDLRKIECFRLSNVFFCVGNFYLIYKILRSLHKKCEKYITLLNALSIAMFPVLYFFTFLYYTDTGSTFFILLMYYYHMKNNYLTAAIAGAVSIMFRQTNIVWVFYVAADETLQTFVMLCKDSLEKEDKEVSSMTYFELAKQCWPIWREHWKELLERIIEINCGYILVAICFISCFVLNGSLALGDKEAHQISFNIPQIFYFFLSFLFFASPFLISFNKAKQFFRFFLTYNLYVSLLVAVCTLCIMHLSYIHPYLLADNRHLTFYIWRRLLGRNVYLSLGLIPIYIYSSWSIASAIQHKNIISKLMLAFCIFVSVVPQKLFELRYFIIPHIMLRIHLKVESKWQPYLEFLLHTIINYAVLYLFLFKTFTWENSSEVQRFMW